MYCKNCGKEINDKAVICPGCGVPTNSANQPYASTQMQKKENTLAIVGLVLSFFVALAGLICSILGYKKAAELNGEGKGMATAGIIISSIELASTVIGLGIYIVGIILAISAGGYPYY